MLLQFGLKQKTRVPAVTALTSNKNA